MFSVGDVVVLKSGGPKMTVTYLGDRGVSCSWFKDGQIPAWHEFPAEALTRTSAADVEVDSPVLDTLRQTGSFED